MNLKLLGQLFSVRDLGDRLADFHPASPGFYRPAIGEKRRPRGFPDELAV